jgi:hypothetical protein
MRKMSLSGLQSVAPNESLQTTAVGGG